MSGDWVLVPVCVCVSVCWCVCVTDCTPFPFFLFVKDSKHQPVENGVEAMRNGQDGAVLEHSADGALDELVRLKIHSCCCFIQHEYSCAAQNSARQANQLPLPNTKVVT